MRRFLDDASSADEMIAKSKAAKDHHRASSLVQCHQSSEGTRKSRDTDDVVENEHFDFKDVDILLSLRKPILEHCASMSAHHL